jgi:YggT family protein
MVLYQLLGILQWLIIARAVVSWIVSPASRNPLVTALRAVTDPILQPIHAILPRTGPVDLSPIVALFALYLLQSLVAQVAMRG